MNDSCAEMVSKEPFFHTTGTLRGQMHTFLCTFSFLKISVASSRCALSRILSFGQ
jgi:hypothetical protein